MRDVGLVSVSVRFQARRTRIDMMIFRSATATATRARLNFEVRSCANDARAVSSEKSQSGTYPGHGSFHWFITV